MGPADLLGVGGVDDVHPRPDHVRHAGRAALWYDFFERQGGRSMAFSIYGNPSCPECREPIAAKSMAFACGSCGHKIEPVQSCGGRQTFGCMAGFALLLIALGAYAD